MTLDFIRHLRISISEKNTQRFEQKQKHVNCFKPSTAGKCEQVAIGFSFESLARQALFVISSHP